MLTALLDRVDRALTYYTIGRNVHRGVRLEAKAGLKLHGHSTLHVARMRGEVALLKGAVRHNGALAARDVARLDVALAERLGDPVDPRVRQLAED